MFCEVKTGVDAYSYQVQKSSEHENIDKTEVDATTQVNLRSSIQETEC